MDNKDFYKFVRSIFLKADTNVARVAEKAGTSKQNLHRKLTTGTLRTIEFLDILDMLGNKIEIKKKNDQ